MSEPADGDLVEIYTDGACSGNPGPGGWGALLIWRGSERELFGGERNTTNNRMELQAAIEGLRVLKRGMQVRLYTDSTYVRSGITTWIHDWKRRGWKTTSKKPVKNVELWRELDAEMGRHDVEIIWVKGHAGIEGNERADELARRGIDELD